MSVELKEKQDGSIPVSEMRDGQIGVISEWNGLYDHIGTIVQRHGERLIGVGLPYECGWSEILKKRCEMSRVKILKNETELIIKDNE